MREILFRGKRIDNGELVCGLFIKDFEIYGHEDEHSYIVTHEHPSGCFGADIYFEVDPETVGQYTGLTDKNGKRIFEGDIVKHYHDKNFPESYSKGVIYWDEEYLRWKRTSENVKVCIAPDCTYEVIGNIHDNPELLKGGE